MQSINVDDNTYTIWNQQAEKLGISVEDWLKQKMIVAEDLDVRNPEDLTYDEWQIRYNNFKEIIKSMNIRIGDKIDWSRYNIYND